MKESTCLWVWITIVVLFFFCILSKKYDDLTPAGFSADRVQSQALRMGDRGVLKS